MVVVAWRLEGHAERQLVVRQLSGLAPRAEMGWVRSLAWCLLLLVCSCRGVGRGEGAAGEKSRREVVGAGRRPFVGPVDVDPFVEVVLGEDWGFDFGRGSFVAIQAVGTAIDVEGEGAGLIDTFLVDNGLGMVV